jgi:hypothetical protein
MNIGVWITNTNDDQTFLLKGIVFEVELKNSLDEKIYGIIVWYPEGFEDIGPQQLKPHETHGLTLPWKVEKDSFFNIDIIPEEGYKISAECNLMTESGKSVKINSSPIFFEILIEK